MSPNPNRPWNSRPAVRQSKSENYRRNRAAIKKLTDCEIETGRTAEELAAVQAEQRARVLARLERAA